MTVPYKFQVNGEFVKAPDPKSRRAMQAQWQELQDARDGAESGGYGNAALLAINALELQYQQQGKNFQNVSEVERRIKVNEQIDLMYRDIDNTPSMEVKATGNQALLSRLINNGSSVNIGTKLYKTRRVSEVAGAVNRSMSGQKGIVIDHTQSNYQGAVIPVFDAAYGLDWRDREAGINNNFDQLAEDSVEREWDVYENVNNYLWNGDSSLNIEGTSWAGLKGSQQGIASYTLQVDLSAPATTATQVVNELIAARDVLRITNRQSGKALKLAVSPQIYSNWERISSTEDSTFGNIMTTVKAFVSGIEEVFEDSNLTGNQIFFYSEGFEGLQAKIGMAMSTYALPRFKHNDDFTYVKWMAAGFIARETYGGRDSCLYASS